MTTELLAELEALRQQVAMDTVRFKEIQEHGARVEVEIKAFRKVALAAKAYKATSLNCPQGTVEYAASWAWFCDALTELNQQHPNWEKE